MVPYSSLAEDSSQVSSSGKKLRLACDLCHSAKTRCCGSSPCARCLRCGTRCVYSQSNRAGRPKGTRNKKSVDNAKLDNDHRDSSSPQQQEQQRQQESQQPPTRNALNRSSSSSSETGKQSSSISSFAVPSFSPPLEHSQLHLQQQKYASNMIFDFNPSSDFSDQTNTILHSSLPPHGHFSFPMVSNDMNIDAMDIQMAFNLDLNLDESQQGCNVPNLTENFTISRHDTGTSGTSMTDILRDTILQSFDQDEIPYSYQQQACPEPLSKSSTNSHSNGNSSGSSGSPSMLHSRDPIDPLLSSKSAQSISLLDNISLAELRCQCLQRHVQFLAHLQELLQGFDQLPLDVVLNGVDQGLKVWDLCLQCRTCQQDRNREVMLLTITSIRAVARILQKASQRIYTQPHFDDREQHSSSSGGSESGSEIERQTRLGKFTFGSYEIKGEESWLVLGVILTRMLAKIQIVLLSFKKSLNSPNSHTVDSHRGDNCAEYLHKLLEGLQANIHALSANLMGGTYDRLG